MSTELKIKLKSLAAEARIIRQEEKKRRGKNWGSTGNTLHEHRIHVVRPEARATHIAYAFLRGGSLESVEGSAKTEPEWKRVEAMVRKYSWRKLAELQDWKKGLISKAA